MRYTTIDAWENANPYDDVCDKSRCVKGKNCTECNRDGEDLPYGNLAEESIFDIVERIKFHSECIKIYADKSLTFDECQNKINILRRTV